MRDRFEMPSPYHRWITGWEVNDEGTGLVRAKPIIVDVYCVLDAYPTGNPALDHLIKKALCPGGRGHKDRIKDVKEIQWSAGRALDLEQEKPYPMGHPKIQG